MLSGALHIRAALFLGTASLSAISYAASPDDSITFSVPAGSLQASLLVIAAQSQQTISFSPELVANYHTAPLSGRLTTREAILRLLQSKPLLLTTTANGTLTVVSSRTSDVDTAQQQQKTLPAITVTGQSEDETVLNAASSSSALRTDTPLQQTAQSVQVITSKLLTARQATSIEDALKNSGSTVSVRSNRGTNTFWLRGQNITSGLTDGVSGSGNVGIGQGTAIEGIERIEVLKGPQSVLSGSSSPAGTINVVRKKPVTDPLHRVKVETASHGEFKTAIDLGGALTDDKAFSYRLNASTMKSSSAFPDYNGDHADYLAPALAWKGETTRVVVGAEFSQSRNSGPAGTFYTDGKVQKLSTLRLGDKDDHFSTGTKNAWFEIEQDLVDGWTFNSKGNYQSTYGQVKMNETLDIADNGDKVSHPLSNKFTNQTWSLQNDVRGTVELGPVKQTLLLGHDYQYERYASYDSNFVLLNNGNVYDPGSLVYPGIGEPDYQSYTSKLIQSGFLLQDQIDLWERLHLQLSLKHSSWNNSFVVSGKPSSYTTSKWIPNYGVSFDITPDVTAYANLLHSFSGNAQVDTETDTTMPPTTGKSKEAGLKFNFLDDDLTVTTAVFDIRQENLVIYSNGRPIGTEGRRTKGFDLDVNGTLLPGWDLSASYTWTQNEDPSLVSSTDIPKHSGNVWTSWEFQDGLLQGAGASVGVRTQSKTTKNGVKGNYFTIGSQTQTDVAIFYHQPKWSLQLGVDNVFDRDIYYGTSTPLYVGVQDGRTWRLTGTYEF
ncbi:TonB-dependent siderophore receptor [Klebsiella oxytoca]|uniref:TonB-dependent siderophore receptor n=1 Tax=Klebsiella oxytoca TaxID=571 RepID=UPI00292F8FC0|nr:TonB-dependent receptor [Klebsiella oxytoca]